MISAIYVSLKMLLNMRGVNDLPWEQPGMKPAFYSNKMVKCKSELCQDNLVKYFGSDDLETRESISIILNSLKDLKNCHDVVDLGIQKLK